MNSPVAWLLLAVLVGLAWRHGLPAAGNTPIAASAASADRTDGCALPAFLPAEARATVALIQRGGPFPHPQDGSVFGNYEGHLPRQPRGWYHEYTVPTPGARNRGMRRIVTGGTPPREWYYSDDHYASFRRFDVP
ncbi:ribonuclease domain-containing protein [Thermomonas sp. S9]|uniref:ribonuclease domain-containing protein n=1 Tax=Thermomonas sp. S9 TaxID=2885203 RepID=UPI00216B0B1F|nr:ribonuclease domain-containing protein [Thermomonas sp. S9]